MKNCKLRNQRPKAFWGALISSLVPSLFSFAGSIASAKQQAAALRKQQEEQNRLARQQNEIARQSSMAGTLNNYADTQNIIEDDKYLGQYNNGGKVNKADGKVLAGGRKIKITNNLSLLRGNLHGQPNEIGGDGMTIQYGNKQIDAQDGELDYKVSPYSHYIISDEPELGIYGISPAKFAIVTGRPDIATNIQETNKRRLGLKSSPVKKRWGDYVGTPEYINLGGDVLSAFGGLAANAMLRNININPVLAQHTDVSAVSIPTKVKSWGKYRSLARAAGNSMLGVSRNTASSSTANDLRQRIATNEAEEFAKVYDSDYEKTLDNIRFNAQNEQQARLANQQGRQQINLANQQVQMDAIKANADIAMTRASNINRFISDLGTAAVNFGSQYRQNINDYRSLAAYLAAGKDNTIDRFLTLGVDIPNRIRRRWEDYKNRQPLNISYIPNDLQFPTMPSLIKNINYPRIANIPIVK